MYEWQSYLLPAVTIYYGIGFTFNLILFAIAKIKALDERYPGWDEIINSLSGFFYFFGFISFLWLPALLSLMRVRKNKELTQTEDEDPEKTWWWHIQFPYRSIKYRRR